MPEMTRRHHRLLAWLGSIAAIGEAAPLVPHIRRQMGLAHDSYAEQMLNDLAEAGMIRIEGVGNGRVITIVETGHRTKTVAARVSDRDELPPTIKRATAKGDPMDRLLIVSRQTQDAHACAVAAARTKPCKRSAPPPKSVPEPAPTSRLAPPPPATANEDTAMPKHTAADVAAAPAIPGLKADVEFSDGELRLTIWLSTDPGPVKAFRPFMTVPLDESGALELMGTAAIALRQARDADA